MGGKEDKAGIGVRHLLFLSCLSTVHALTPMPNPPSSPSHQRRVADSYGCHNVVIDEYANDKEGFL